MKPSIFWEICKTQDYQGDTDNSTIGLCTKLPLVMVHCWLSICLFKWFHRGLRLFSDVWSENPALFKRLMKIHSNPPILLWLYYPIIVTPMLVTQIWPLSLIVISCLFIGTYPRWGQTWRGRHATRIQRAWALRRRHGGARQGRRCPWSGSGVRSSSWRPRWGRNSGSWWRYRPGLMLRRPTSHHGEEPHKSYSLCFVF